ncbi:Ionotropic glutamate receptor [Trinorchestia longiramus]|nr:Ionotropic glutamate receptor [Trinorchestia longiramus]
MIGVLVQWSPPIVDLSVRPYKGFHIELFRIIMEHLGWCYHLLEPPDKKLGFKENGNFTGATGMIVREEVDMLMGPVAQDTSRAMALNFAYGYFQSSSSLIYRRITHTQPDMFILTKPFFNQRWLDLLLCSSTIFTTADLSHAPKGDAGHMLTISWLFVSFMFALMYKCNLKAILINDKIKLPFTNAEEFANQNEYLLTWIDGKVYGPFYKAHAEQSPEKPIGKMWAKRTELISTAEVISTALTKKVAVVDLTLGALSYMAEDFSELGECRVSLADSGVEKVYMSFAFPWKTTLKEDVDRVLLRLYQAGIPQQLQAMNLRNASWCTKPDTKHESRAIAVTDLLGIFIICALGG